MVHAPEPRKASSQKDFDMCWEFVSAEITRQRGGVEPDDSEMNALMAKLSKRCGGDFGSSRVIDFIDDLEQMHFINEWAANHPVEKSPLRRVWKGIRSSISALIPGTIKANNAFAENEGPANEAPKAESPYRLVRLISKIRKEFADWRASVTNWH